MYLVVTKSNEKIILNTAEEVKSINKEDISKIYALSEVDYKSIVSTSDIRDCIYDILKGKQMTKEEVIEIAQLRLGISKSNISKAITAMKKEKIIYVIDEFGWLGVD